MLNYKIVFATICDEIILTKLDAFNLAILLITDPCCHVHQNPAGFGPMIVYNGELVSKLSAYQDLKYRFVAFGFESLDF